jgi:hypothetical protein
VEIPPQPGERPDLIHVGAELVQPPDHGDSLKFIWIDAGRPKLLSVRLSPRVLGREAGANCLDLRDDARQFVDWGECPVAVVLTKERGRRLLDVDQDSKTNIPLRAHEGVENLLAPPGESGVADVGGRPGRSIGTIDDGIVAMSSLWANERVYYPLRVAPSTPAACMAGGVKADPPSLGTGQLRLCVLLAHLVQPD